MKPRQLEAAETWVLEGAQQGAGRSHPCAAALTQPCLTWPGRGGISLFTQQDIQM